MTYIPLKKDKSPLVISLILFLCAAVCLTFFAINIGNRVILQLIMAVTAMASVVITTRYTLSGFVYILNNSVDLDKSPGFKVIRTQGMKKINVCNLSLDTAVAIIPKIPLKEIKNKYGKILRRFNYCVNMFPDESYIYIYEVNGGINIIEIELNTDFYQMFKFMIGQQ